jgi:CheY-like chemotaxis protein
MSSFATQAPAILIVEDDFDIREALTQILETEGYPVAGATNGREALDYLSSHQPPCVILLDLMMPVMDGWQFREAQQRDPNLSKIPVVVISADASVMQKAASINAVGYLKKPIELDHLLEIIGRFC